MGEKNALRGHDFHTKKRAFLDRGQTKWGSGVIVFFPNSHQPSAVSRLTEYLAEL
jgi:hypothetical protein